MAAVRALAGVEAADTRQIQRLFLQEILAEQFGEVLIQDAKFQAVVDGVLDTLSKDETGNALLNRVVKDIAAQGS